MAGDTPLAQAFVAVRADTSRVKGDVSAGFDGIDSESAGKKVGSGFMTGLKTAAATAAIGGIFKFGSDSIESYKEAEQAQTRLSDAFTKFPALADTNKDALMELNGALATKTRFDDDALASGQSVLAQFGLTGQQIKDLTPLLADYAAKTGTDAPTAAEQLGKALLGQGRALKSVGIDFQDAGSVGANFDQIMGGLRTQVGGFAEQEGQTAAGKAEILKNQFGELQEAVGSALVPALQTLADKLLTAVGFVQDNANVIGPLAAVVGGLALTVWAVNAATGAWAAIQAAANAVHVVAIAQWIAHTAAAAAHGVISGVVTVATGAWTAAQWLLNNALRDNPIGIVITAIALLVAALVWAWNNSETFRNIVTGAWNAIKGAAEAVVNWFVNTAWPFLQNVWNGIKDGIGGVANWFGEKWNAIKGAAQAVSDWFSGTLVPGIASVWNALKEAAAAPIRFVVNTVFAGVVERFNAVSDFLHGPHINPPHVDFDSGGYTGPGGKYQPAGIVHAGEFVFTQEQTRRAGVGNMYRLAQSLGGYADGGFVGALGNLASGLWSFVTDPIGSFKGLIDGLVGGIESSPVGQMAVGLVRRVVDAIGEKIGSLFSAPDMTAATDAGGAGVQRWAGVASQAMAMAGLPASYLPLLLHRMNVESGGNPMAINLWDSNAKAGHPSQGLMQTIPGTFNAYAGELVGRGINDPLANIYAAIRYTLARYGLAGIERAWGGSGGYALGGLVRTFDRGGVLDPGYNTVYNGTGRPEPLTPLDGQRLYLVLEDGTELRAYVRAEVARPAQMASAGRRTV